MKTNEDLNASVYEKLCAEQEEFKEWMLSLEPKEMLHHAYEYVIREDLVFLKEHHIDTETFKKALSGRIALTGTNVDFILKGINAYLLALAKEQIRLAFEQSEKEVEDLHQRTREGLVTAKLHGKQVGREKGVGFETKKSASAKKMIREHSKTFGGSLDDA